MAKYMRERKTDTVWDLVDAARRESSIAHDDPGFTISDYVERYKVARNTANDHLRAMVKKEKLIEGWRIQDGKRIRVYRFPTD